MLRSLLLCFMLLTLVVIEAGLASRSTTGLDAVSDHIMAESYSCQERIDDAHDCEHDAGRTCCAHSGCSKSILSAEPMAVARDSHVLVFSLRADAPCAMLAPTPELAPPRPTSA